MVLEDPMIIVGLCSNFWHYPCGCVSRSRTSYCGFAGWCGWWCGYIPRVLTTWSWHWIQDGVLIGYLDQHTLDNLSGDWIMIAGHHTHLCASFTDIISIPTTMVYKIINFSHPGGYKFHPPWVYKILSSSHPWGIKCPQIPQIPHLGGIIPPPPWVYKIPPLWVYKILNSPHPGGVKFTPTLGV